MIPNSFSDFWPSSNALSSVAPQLWNHLWQSTLFTVAVALLAFTLRRYPARIRYWLWMTASVKFLLPFSLLVAAGAHFTRPIAPAPSVTTAYVAIDEVSEPFTVTPDLTPSVPVVPQPVRTHHLSLPVTLAALWLCGFTVVLAVWLFHWQRVAVSVRRSNQLFEGRVADTLRRVEQLARIAKPIPLLSSTGTMEPGIFGILRPVLLWPEAISAHLDDVHLEAVLAHEAYHVRRRDNLTSLVHMLVEALFWFHPLVWWMESQLVKERERACDEEVLLLCSRPQAYAEGILKVCEFCVESPLKCVSGITGADLKKRIVRIMTNHVVRQLGVGVKCFLLIVALAALAVPFALGQVKAARTMMLTALKSAPDSVRVAASAMIAKTDAPPAEESQIAPDADAAVDETSKDPAFEVAVIRPSNPTGRVQWMGTKVEPSGRVSVSQMSVEGLVYFAYVSYLGTPQGGQVAGGPKWVDSDQFDIEAKVDDAQMTGWDKLSDTERMQRVKPMMRRLLVDRFQLKLHTETRITPVYALVQAKGGAKLKEVAPPPRNANPEEVEKSLRGNTAADKPPAGSFTFSARGWVANAVPIQTILGQIAGETGLQDRPIVDETGLKGYYDFTANISHDKDGPSGEAQVEDQLGLKLEARKVPMKTYVIDSAEKPSVDGGAAQDVPSSSAPTPATNSQSAVVGRIIKFEVASIRQNKTGIGGGRGPTADGYNVRNMFPVILLSIAYGVPDFQRIQGLPEWCKVGNEGYDIDAKVADSDVAEWRQLSPHTFSGALQALLQDRFQLKAHFDTRDAPAYALVVAKNGPKFKAATPGDTYPNGEHDRQGKAGLGFSHKTEPGSDHDLLIAQAESMTAFAQYLSGFGGLTVGRPVVDKTGLAGLYDFSMPVMADWEARREPDPSEPSIFTVLQDSLGLRLEPATAPVQFLVIDHIERPTEN